MSVFKMFVGDHWPKLLAAILVPVILGAIALWLGSQERKEERIDNGFVETGRKEVRAEQQERTIANVKAAQDAVDRPTLDARDRVMREQDRCSVTPAACE